MKIEESVQANIQDILKNDEVAEKIISFNRDLLPKTTEKEINNEITISGFSVILPVLNALSGPESNLSIIDYDHRKLLMYAGCNIDDYEIGVNAFAIRFNLSTKKLIWGKAFEEFLSSKEIKIINWNRPLKDMLDIFLLREQFDCYFDIKHHLNALENFLNLDKEVLTQQSIDLSLNSQESNLLKSFLSPYKTFYFEGTNIKSKKKGYTYINNFIKTLPPGSSKIISKTVDLFSPTSKKSHLMNWKKSTLSTKTLALIYEKNDFSKVILKTFSFFFKNFSSREDLVKELLVTDKEFKEAMMAYKKLNKDLSAQEMKSLLKSGIMRELINYSNESILEDGPILNLALGRIPSHEIILNEPKYFNGFQVDQVKSVLQLKRIGKELTNCLRYTDDYWNYVVDPNNHYFFYFQAPKGSSLKSFICLINLESNSFNLIEAFRKSNQSLSIDDHINLTSFLSSEGIALLPRDVFIVSFGVDFLRRLSDTGPDKIIEFISKNKDFMAFILKESLRDLSDLDFNQAIAYSKLNGGVSTNSIPLIKNHLVKLFPKSKYKIDDEIIDRALKNYSSNFFFGTQQQLSNDIPF